MPNANIVILMGNLTRDPQLRYLGNQTAICEFGLAINRKFKKDNEEREEVTFVDCTAWGRTAEVINEHFQKGKAIMIEGRLKFDTWEDKQGGGKRSKLSVVAERFQFVGGPSDGNSNGNGNNAPASRAPSSRPQQRQQPEQPFGDEEQFKEDDIPFAFEGRDQTPI